jgi:hypothetical protein
MGRTCSVCRHEARYEIERQLVNRSASYRVIASQYGLTQAAVGRHVRSGHIAELLAKGHEAEQMAEVDKILTDVKRLQARTLLALNRAENSGDLRSVLAAVAQARQNIALMAELRGELDRRAVINISVTPSWIQLRTLIVGALQEHPEALMAVRRAIEQGEEETHGRAER